MAQDFGVMAMSNPIEPKPYISVLEPKMTGREWYEKFIAEVEKSEITSSYSNNPLLVFNKTCEVFKEAARKAAGL